MNIEESKDIYNELRIAADVDNEFLEDSFVEYVEKLLSDAGIYENIQKVGNDNLGIRIDGYNWNLRKNSFILLFDSAGLKIKSSSESDIEKLGKGPQSF